VAKTKTPGDHREWMYNRWNVREPKKGKERTRYRERLETNAMIHQTVGSRKKSLRIKQGEATTEKSKEGGKTQTSERIGEGIDPKLQSQLQDWEESSPLISQNSEMGRINLGTRGGGTTKGDQKKENHQNITRG